MNHRLELEITERRATEADLHAAQDSLVLVDRLAALGQMSAALSDDINQPLATTRIYADSAAILIVPGDTLSARNNIAQIMVPLARLVVEKQMIIGVRPAAVDAQLDLDVPDDLPPLLAGPTRVQQVLWTCWATPPTRSRARPTGGLPSLRGPMTRRSRSSCATAAPA